MTAKIGDCNRCEWRSATGIALVEEVCADFGEGVASEVCDHSAAIRPLLWPLPCWWMACMCCSRSPCAPSRCPKDAKDACKRYHNKQMKVEYKFPVK